MGSTVRILVTADTHIPDWYQRLPERLMEDAGASDLILLAGDIVSGEVIDVLSACAPVEAVYGNFCDEELKRSLPSKKTFQLSGWRIGLTHGHLGNGRDADEKSLSLFDGGLDVLVHGHTHNAHQRKIEEVLVVEPGSPLDTKFTSSRSYAILTLDDEVSVEFVRLP